MSERPARALWYANRRRVAALHATGISLMALSLLALLARVEIVSNASLRVDVAVVMVFLVGGWLLVVDWPLGLGALGLSIVLYLIAVVLPLWLAAALIVPGIGIEAVARIRARRL